MAKRISVMAIMAHQDDFEFNAGGIFALLRKTYGKDARLKILVTTRGATGHHIMGLEETYRRREKEAMRSAALIGAEYECLRQLDGSHIHGAMYSLDRNLAGGIWNAIRAFEPDYIFCPPVITDPLAGVHIDHINTANLVRLLAYQIIVPHAYPTMDGPVKKRVASPVIVNVDDSYACESAWHVALKMDKPVWNKKLAMARCHESQIYEWLPWTNAMKPPTPGGYDKAFRLRHTKINTRYGKPDDAPREFFRMTHWGRTPTMADFRRLFPTAELSEAGKKYLG